MLYNYTLHKDSSPTLISAICALKMQHWKYSLEEHKEWINKNLEDEDIHLTLLGDDDTLIGYLDMVNLELRQGSSLLHYMGIGNVCIDRRYSGQGFGERLVAEASSYIDSLGQGGVLLCKAPLVPFYVKCAWTPFDGNTYVDGKEYEHFAMFLHRMENPQSIEINRAF